jgi:carboxyl-terminal processing protease
MAPSIKGLVIDLSQAASGDEDEVIGLANLLLSTGSIGSKSTRIDLGNRKWEASSSTDGEQPELATALVVDRGTAGLAELLAAALRKPARAILIGRQTAGYDTLETLRPLQDGSALQVTSTRLWGPDKLSLSEGVQPHLKTDRVGLLDLALSILNQTTGPTMEQLLEAARKVVN